MIVFAGSLNRRAAAVKRPARTTSTKRAASFKRTKESSNNGWVKPDATAWCGNRYALNLPWHPTEEHMPDTPAFNVNISWGLRILPAAIFLTGGAVTPFVLSGTLAWLMRYQLLMLRERAL
jgi:hypothetical protein